MDEPKVVPLSRSCEPLVERRVHPMDEPKVVPLSRSWFEPGRDSSLGLLGHRM